MFELHRLGCEAPDCHLDVAHLPTQNRVGRQRDFAHDCHTQHGAIRVEYQRVFVFGNQKQTEHVAIERFRAGRVGGGDERDDGGSSQHIAKEV